MNAYPEDMAGELSLADGVCLCLITTPPTAFPAHGWQLVRELAPDGVLGAIWSLSRPLTYRSIDALETRGFIERDRSDPTARRQTLTPTNRGRTAAFRWLDLPVSHIRDLRTEFLMKCELRALAGLDIATFAHRQRLELAEALGTLVNPQQHPAGIVGIWRHHNAIAARAVLDNLADQAEPTAELR